MQGRPDFWDRQTARPNDEHWRQSIPSQQPYPRPIAGGDWSSYRQGSPDLPFQPCGTFPHQTTGSGPPELGPYGAFSHPLPHQGGPPNHWPVRTPYQQTPEYLQPPRLGGINQMADQTLAGLGPRFGLRPGGSFAPRPYPPMYVRGADIGQQQLGREGILPTPVPGTYDSAPDWRQTPPPASAQMMQAAPRAVWPLAQGPNGSGVVPARGVEGRHGPIPTSQSGNVRQIRQEDPRSGASNDKPQLESKRPRNGYTHGPSSLSLRDAQAASQPDIKPPIKQYLERDEIKPVGGVKRPASAPGGEGKRQRTEAPRVPGWKAKAAEAVDVTDQFALEDVNKDAFKKKVERETDAHRLAQRQKQIDFGKNTLGYERYLEATPKAKRQKGDPVTPKIHQVCSKRSWDGQIKKWRRFLHRYDPPVDDEAEFAEEEYVPGYRDNPGGVKEDETGAEGALEESAEEEEPAEVKASIFEDDEDEFVGL